MTVQNLWGIAKAALKGKFIAIQSHLREQEKISNKQSHLTSKAIRERRQKETQS